MISSIESKHFDTIFGEFVSPVCIAENKYNLDSYRVGDGNAKWKVESSLRTENGNVDISNSKNDILRNFVIFWIYLSKYVI